MLKIMEVHPSANPACEYVVLQNVGLVTVNLRGCAICTDGYLTANMTNGRSESETMYIFRDEIAIKPYTRVVLFTGTGEDGWVPTIDGKQAYCAYWDRAHSVWAVAEQVHVLQVTTSRRIPPAVTPPQGNRNGDRSHHEAPPLEADNELTRAEIERQKGCTFVCVGETEW